MSYIPKKLVNPGLYATGDNFLDATTRDVYRVPYHANLMVLYFQEIILMIQKKDLWFPILIKL